METNKKGYMNNLGSSYKEFKKANPDVNITELGYKTLKRPDVKSEKAKPMGGRPSVMKSMGKKKGGEVKKSTGSFRTSANGITKKGKTKAKQVKMAKGGWMC